jgi:hypothetical protein
VRIHEAYLQSRGEPLNGGSSILIFHRLSTIPVLGGDLGRRAATAAVGDLAVES